MQDDKFIIDESQLLLPPPSPAPPAPVQHVPGPPGALSGDQLSVVVAALQEASSGTGYIPVSDTVELMRRLAAQGEGHGLLSGNMTKACSHSSSALFSWWQACDCWTSPMMHSVMPWFL